MDEVLINALEVNSREEIFKVKPEEKAPVAAPPAPAPQVAEDLVRH